MQSCDASCFSLYKDNCQLPHRVLPPCRPIAYRLYSARDTAIPSSAAVERLFSIGKDILTAKRAKLSDAKFERLMFMKGNQHHVAGMQAEQAASGRKSQINKP